MECLTCKNKMPELKDLSGKDIYNLIESDDDDNDWTSQQDYWMEISDNIKSAYATNLENGENHFAYVCTNCWSIHVYCQICQKWAKLVERSVCMEGFDHCTLVSWRDETGCYHSTSVESVFKEKCEEFVNQIINEIDGYPKDMVIDYLCTENSIDSNTEFTEKYGKFIKKKFVEKFGKKSTDLY